MTALPTGKNITETVFDYIQQSGKQTIEQALEGLGEPPEKRNSVGSALSRLFKAGRLVREGKRGRYIYQTREAFEAEQANLGKTEEPPEQQHPQGMTPQEVHSIAKGNGPMNPADLIALAQRQGVSLLAVGPTLRCNHDGVLEEDLASLLRQHKPALLAYIKSEGLTGDKSPLSPKPAIPLQYEAPAPIITPEPPSAALQQTEQIVNQIIEEERATPTKPPLPAPLAAITTPPSVPFDELITMEDLPDDIPSLVVLLQQQEADLKATLKAAILQRYELIQKVRQTDPPKVQLPLTEAEQQGAPFDESLKGS